MKMKEMHEHLLDEKLRCYVVDESNYVTIVNARPFYFVSKTPDCKTATHVIVTWRYFGSEMDMMLRAEPKSDPVREVFPIERVFFTKIPW